MDNMSYVNYVMFGASVPEIDIDEDKENDIDLDNLQKYVNR